MHLIIIQLQRQSPPFLAQFIFFIGRPHNEARINTSNVSSFNWLLRSLFIQLCLKNSSTRIVKLAELKFWSQNCRSYWNLEVYARMPRLESNYVAIYKLQPFYFVTCGFWKGLHCEGWKLCKARFCEVPQKQNKKTYLTGIEDFNVETWLRSFRPVRAMKLMEILLRNIDVGPPFPPLL